MTLSFSSRRTLLICALALGPIALLTGCGDGTATSSTTGSPGSTCTADAPPDPTPVLKEKEATHAVAFGGPSLYYFGTISPYQESVSKGLGVVPLEGGHAKLVSSNADNASALAADDSAAYYSSGTVVVRATPDGMPDQQIYISPAELDVGQMVIDATSYYVVLTSSMGLQPDAIARGPKAGGPASVIVTLPDTFSHTRGLRVDAKGIYFTTTEAGETAGGTLWRAPLEGGEPTKLVQGMIEGAEIATDDTSVYYFALPYSAASLMKVAREGGTPQQVLTGLNVPHGLAVAADAVYLTELNPDDGTAYSTNQSRIHRVQKDGGCPIVLASDQYATTNAYQTLIVNDSHVYWTTDKGIMSAPR